MHCRCFLQLTVLGYVLVPIFTYKLWWLVLGYAGFMLFIGSWEAAGRPSQSYKVCLLFALALALKINYIHIHTSAVRLS